MPIPIFKAIHLFGSNMKYLVINRTNPNWLFVTAPIADGELSMGVKRKLVIELKKLEKEVKPPLKGWIMYAKLTDPHIMILCLKLGGIPYDIKRGVIWFKKEIL